MSLHESSTAAKQRRPEVGATSCVVFAKAYSKESTEMIIRSADRLCEPADNSQTDGWAVFDNIDAVFYMIP